MEVASDTPRFPSGTMSSAARAAFKAIEVRPMMAGVFMSCMALNILTNDMERA